MIKYITWPVVVLAALIMAFIAFYSYSSPVRNGTQDIVAVLNKLGVVRVGDGSRVKSPDQSQSIILKATLMFRVRRVPGPEGERI